MERRQWIPRSDAALFGIWSEFPLLAYIKLIVIKIEKNTTQQPYFVLEMDSSNW